MKYRCVRRIDGIGQFTVGDCYEVLILPNSIASVTDDDGESQYFNSTPIYGREQYVGNYFYQLKCIETYR